jgi:hypothetical protein
MEMALTGIVTANLLVSPTEKSNRGILGKRPVCPRWPEFEAEWPDGKPGDLNRLIDTLAPLLEKMTR